MISRALGFAGETGRFAVLMSFSYRHANAFLSHSDFSGGDNV